MLLIRYALAVMLILVWTIVCSALLAIALLIAVLGLVNGQVDAVAAGLFAATVCTVLLYFTYGSIA